MEIGVIPVLIGIVGIAGTVIGIIAGAVQIIEFFQKRRQEKQSKQSHELKTLDDTASYADITDSTGNSSNRLEIFHNLPAPNKFVGRKDEKERGHEALLLSRPNIVSIYGIGGVGKTSLALEIAYECLEASKGDNPLRRATFDSFIWTTAKDRELVLDNILDEVARTLNRPIVMKQSLEYKRDSIRKIFQDKRCLLIVDGFEAIKDKGTRDFLLHDIPEKSKILITTREQNISDVWMVSLKGLSESEALQLIRFHGETLDLASADDNDLLRLCRATEGHPLATKWALGQIKQKGQSLNAVLELLDKAEGSFFFQDLFSGSWNLLSENAKRILRRMPIFANDAFQEAIKEISDIDEDGFDAALKQLTEMSLINVTDNQDVSGVRYSIHQLTRSFVRAKLEGYPQTAYKSKRDLAAFFETYTQKHGGLWNLHGFERLKPDIPNIISVTRWCWQEKENRKLVETGINIFDNIRYFLVNYGLWNTALELALEAIKLFPFNSKKPPKRLEEWQTKIVLFRVWPIAWIYRFRGKYDLAKNEINQVLELFTCIKDEQNIAYAKRHLSLVLQKTGELKSARKYLTEALKYHESIQDEYRIMLVKADLSELAIKQKDFETARQLSTIVHDIAPKIVEERDDQKLQQVARFYKVLGKLAKNDGNILQAKEMCEKALKLTERLDYLDGIADALSELAQIDLEEGHNCEARQKYERAYKIYKTLDMGQEALEIESALNSLEPSNANN